MTKIMIGLPSGGETKTDTSMCLMDLSARLKEVHGGYSRCRSFAPVDEARNMVADEFLPSDCSHLLFVDWDATFPVHSAETLLEADKDIIGVNAAFKIAGTPVITHNIDGKELNFVKHKIEQVNQVGMHLTLIKRKVLETMPWPWFFRDIIYDQRKLGGEDFTFCRNAAQNYDFEVWIHNYLSAEIGHINGTEIKTLESHIRKQIREAEQELMRAKIKQLKQEVECS
jgi:hypothetical protein